MIILNDVRMEWVLALLLNEEDANFMVKKVGNPKIQFTPFKGIECLVLFFPKPLHLYSSKDFIHVIRMEYNHTQKVLGHSNFHFQILQIAASSKTQSTHVKNAMTPATFLFNKQLAHTLRNLLAK